VLVRHYRLAAFELQLHAHQHAHRHSQQEPHHGPQSFFVGTARDDIERDRPLEVHQVE
jgi:hypothetical protein